MVGAAYAAVPLYNWFCRTTGFAGTTQVGFRTVSSPAEHRLCTGDLELTDLPEA